VDAGRTQLIAASAAVDELRTWRDNAPTLIVWIRTASAMIRAMHRLVDAVEDRDAAAARQARVAFDAAAKRAPQADRALRIGMGEGGSALTATPLRRLAGVLRGLEELDVAVRAVLAEAGR
jgi:prolyl oligopeptidase PreP (S9A serine peptidase family)